MKAEELARCQRYLELTVPQMAVLLGAQPRTYWRWIAGKTRIPGTVDALMVILLKYPQVRSDAVAAVRSPPL